MNVRGVFFALLMAVCGGAASQGWAWGSQGHQTIALIAQSHLSPAALRMVNDLRSSKAWDDFKPGRSRYFRNADRDLAKFCVLPGLDLSWIADWADAWREHHPSTAAWHYVNIPLDSDATPAAIQDACGGDCILSALDAQLKVLQDPRADQGARLEALFFVVHLVGDLHQPLHCADHADKGGNEVGVFVARRVSNLHAAWDSGFFYTEHIRPETLADDLEFHECRRIPPPTSVGPEDREAWAHESFQIARDFVYPQVQRNNGHFDRREVEVAWPVVRKQLARAGIRLAAILNQAARNGN